MTSRSRILESLLSQTGWVSGAEIAIKLGISRSAVHKQVRSLIADGYHIASAARRGYRMELAPDRLDADALNAHLQTHTLGQTGMLYAPRMDSTNAVARRQALDGGPHGLLVFTDCQTAGRGRRGRVWVSPEGVGIYASLLLRPELPLDAVPLIGLLAAVAATEAVRAEGDVAAGIKWPNDVLLNGRKIAGILLEAASEPDAIEYVVVGLGLNVNAAADQLPERPLYPASSLRIETGQPWRRAPLLAAWLAGIERYWPLLAAGDRRPLCEAWQRLSITAGRRIRAQLSPDTVVEGVDRGIDGDGAMLLRDDTGATHRILSGDLLAGPDN